MKKLLLIDGSSLLHRAFYALPLLSNAEGVYTNAVHGFMVMFNKIVKDEKPHYAAVCFDKSRVTFRTAIAADYKGTRKETPPELRGQFQLIQQVLELAGVHTLELDGFEADDIIGSLARCGAEAGFASNMPLDDSTQCAYLAPVGGAGAADLILSAMASLRIKRLRRFPAFLEEMQRLHGMDVVIISCYTSPDIERHMEALRRAGNAVTLYLLEGGAEQHG